VGVADSHLYTEPGTRCRASEVTRAPTSGAPFSSTKHMCTGGDRNAFSESCAERGDAQPNSKTARRMDDGRGFVITWSRDVDLPTQIQSVRVKSEASSVRGLPLPKST